MLPYFPRLYPDELLYSALARFARQTCQAAGAAQRAAFGTAHQITHSQFGFRIEELAKRVTGLDPRHVLHAHTFFPYLTAFLSPEKIKRLEQLVIAGDRPTCRGLVRVSQTFKKEPGLYYCIDCLADAEAVHGERYWRRVHQLPLVQVCPDHGSHLQVYRLRGVAALRELHAAEPENTPDERPPDLDEVARQHLQELAQQSSDLLEGRYQLGWDRVLSEPGRLNEALALKNYEFGPGRVRWAPIYRHAEDRLRWMENRFPTLFKPDGSLGPWLQETGRVPHLPTEVWQLAAHIVHSLPPRPLPFGHGPWPCLNPLAPNFMAPVVQKVQRVRTNSVTQGTFYCDCGYVYTQQERNDGTRSEPCFKRFGPLLHEHVRKSVVNRWSITRAAREIGLDPKTFCRAMSQENIENVWELGTAIRRDATTGQFAGAGPRDLKNSSAKQS